MAKHVETIFSPEKAQHVILFFLERVNNVFLGKTKLMKLLYYVDFDHYEEYGTPVTGAKYRKLPYGPVAKENEKLLRKMQANGVIEKVEGVVGAFEQERYITESSLFDSTLFSGDELETLKRVAARWEKATAKEISAASHAEAPWATTEDAKVIDYELAVYRKPIEDEPLDDYLATSEKFANYVAELASR